MNEEDPRCPMCHCSTRKGPWCAHFRKEEIEARFSSEKKKRDEAIRNRVVPSSFAASLLQKLGGTARLGS